MTFSTSRILALLMAAFCLTATTARADTVEFPEDELATETVLPVFDKVRSVLNRNVDTTGHFEIGGGPGMALNEPFYSQFNAQFEATYNITDQHAANITFNYFMPGLNSYGNQLKNGQGLQPGQSFDPSKAPEPKWMMLANYQFTAYYGKISLSKLAVMNLSLFGLAGIGMMANGGVSSPALDLGFGQNFYFTPRIAARFDLKLVMYNGPDATSQPLPAGGPKPSEASFAKDWFFKTYLSLGMIFVL